jgi:hypothetical protein
MLVLSKYFIFLPFQNKKNQQMDKKIFTPRFIFILTTIFAAAAMRLIPHWPNFTPIAAMALFGGAYFNRKYLAFLVPLLAMLLSDLVLGFHTTMIAVYIAFSITVMIGFTIAKKPRVWNIALASVASTIIFFFITNFASWLGSPMYPQTFGGLLESYGAGLVFLNDGSHGISFFLNSLLGDLFYTTALFGVFYLARLRFPKLAVVR